MPLVVSCTSVGCNSMDFQKPPRLLTCLTQCSLSQFLLIPLMSVWLSFSQCPKSITTALNQTFSSQTRIFAIKGFARLFGGLQWRMLWAEVGGIEGIFDLFSRLSICEISLLTKIIGHRLKAGKDSARDTAISSLLRALLGVDDANAIHNNPDQRYLNGKYLEMLPACDSSFVEKMLCQRENIVPDHIWALKHFRCHSVLIIQLTTRAAFKDGHLPNRTFQDCLSFCLEHLQQGFPTEVGCSMSMSFALHILRRLAVDERPNLPVDRYLYQLLEPLTSLSWKRRKLIGSRGWQISLI